MKQINKLLQIATIIEMLDSFPIDSSERFRLTLSNIKVPTINGSYVSISITPIQNDILYKELITKYCDWCYLCPTNNTAIEGFETIWNEFIYKNQEQLNRLAITLLAEYDPTHNYNRFENFNEDKSYGTRNSTQTLNTTNTRNFNNYQTAHAFNSENTNTTNDTITNYINQTAINQKTTYDNNSGANSWKNDSRTIIQTGNITTPDSTTTAGNITTRNTNTTANTSGTSTNNTDTTTGSYSDNNSGTNTNVTSVLTPDNTTSTNHLYGNIGVTTTVDMLTQEIQFRLNKNLVDIIIELFAQEYLFLEV